VTTSATTTTASQTATSRVLALAGTETRLLMRNRTVAVSSFLIPIAFGVFWAVTYRGDGSPASYALVIALQLAVVLGMGVYVTATQTLVARRQNRVLKRMRTTGLSDTELLVATVAPIVLLALVQLVVFAVINMLTGVPMAADPGALALAVLGGLALAVTSALATTLVTPTPERAQITTLPLVFVLLGVAIVLAIAPLGGWWQIVVAVPGGAVGQLAQLAMTGATWSPALGGLPAAVPALLASMAWPALLGMLALRRFRWDPRH
jgi:ABC-2 type transport system permease protein